MSALRYRVAAKQVAVLFLEKPLVNEVLEAIPVSGPAPGPDWNRALQLLEQAVRVGAKEADAHYLLAMAYKKLGRNAEARGALAKIAEPDANVWLQRGLLAYAERDFGQAEQDFTKSWDLDPSSFPAGYNLLLARLCQGRQQACVEIVPRLLPLAPPPERRLIELLGALLATPGQLSHDHLQALESMSLDEEARLIDMLTGLAQFDVLAKLFDQLAQARPRSRAVFHAHLETSLRQGKHLLEFDRWPEAQNLLQPLILREEFNRVPVFTAIAVYNLLGVCSCLAQEFDQGANYFRLALEVFQKGQGQYPEGKLPGQVNAQGIYEGAWLEQNLALAHEWQGRLDEAEIHWLRYFDYLEYYFSYSQPPGYLRDLAFQGLERVAEVYSKKERWHSALGFLQKASKIRPGDHEILERMFHLYTQLKRPEDARNVLHQLRQAKPNDPQVELFELDVRDLRDVNDLDNLLADIRKVLTRYPGNLTVEDRASAMIGHLVPFMQKLIEQWTGQMHKVRDQMRRLNSYQINWPVVREVMRDLESQLFQLRRSIAKCLPIVHGEEVRTELQHLQQQCDRRIEQTRTLGGH